MSIRDIFILPPCHSISQLFHFDSVSPKPLNPSNMGSNLFLFFILNKLKKKITVITDTAHVTHCPWQFLLVCICTVQSWSAIISKLSTRFGEDPTMQSQSRYMPVTPLSSIARHICFSSFLFFSFFLSPTFLGSATIPNCRPTCQFPLRPMTDRPTAIRDL